TYPSYALNLAQLGALCISNLCATKPFRPENADHGKDSYAAPLAKTVFSLPFVVICNSADFLKKA
ncbi:hypothetical protein, partial [Acinetobacter ursingii]|uniref:hypothetical protein n=1 Tax=Acinetobacter ursingii TaxID=108980 RepID=UPI002448E483